MVYKKGEPVVCTKECGYLHREGKTGVILKDWDSEDFDDSVCIEFDEWFSQGHDAGGLGRNKHCYYVKAAGVELLYDDISFKKDDIKFSFDSLMETL